MSSKRYARSTCFTEDTLSLKLQFHCWCVSKQLVIHITYQIFPLLTKSMSTVGRCTVVGFFYVREWFKCFQGWILPHRNQDNTKWPETSLSNSNVYLLKHSQISIYRTMNLKRYRFLSIECDCFIMELMQDMKIDRLTTSNV